MTAHGSRDSLFSLREEPDAAGAFELSLAEVRADGAPSAIMAVQSDNGGELFPRTFQKHFAARVVSNTSSSQQPGAAGTSVSTDQHSALAARTQATELHVSAPIYPLLWVEAVSWACHVLDHSKPLIFISIRYVVWFPPPPLPTLGGAAAQASRLQSKERQ